MKDLFLAVETSSPRLSLALGDASGLIGSHKGSLEWRHAETLFTALEALLTSAGARVQDLTGAAVCTGPGSFTGIRIGLAAVRALGQTMRIPVAGVNALEAIAAAAPGRARWIAPRLSGFQGHVFAALYERSSPQGGLRRVLPERRLPEDRWAAALRRRARSGRLWQSDPRRHFPDAETILSLARPRLARAGPGSYRDVRPFYLREASAVERRR